MSNISVEDIKLYRSLFNTRDDVFARYWEDISNKKSGYAPVYRLNQSPQALSNDVIESHLVGSQTIGVYPLFPGNTTSFLAIDFDGANWLNCIQEVVRIAKKNYLPIAVERSKSGNGGHAWFFFVDRIPAILARQFGKQLLHEVGIIDRKTYDRMFPSQNEHAGKGYGNLICLPLQGKLVIEEKTVFLTQDGETILNQWEYLQTIKKLSTQMVEQYVHNSLSTHFGLG